VVVLELSGTLWGGDETLAVVRELERLGIEGHLDAILDLSKVRHIASNGFGILVRARRTYARYGGAFVLCNANSRVLSILEVTRLNLVFDVRATRGEALEAVAEASL
jgi:anti-anti-sigma factor